MVLESSGKCTQKGPEQSWKITFSVLYAPCINSRFLTVMMLIMDCFVLSRATAGKPRWKGGSDVSDCPAGQQPHHFDLDSNMMASSQQQ